MAVIVTEHTNVFRIHLKAGQFLQFDITTAGAKPTFVYQAPNGELVFQAPEAPKAQFSRQWPLAGDDPPVNGVYLLNFGFLGAICYKLVVQQHDASGTVTRDIKDIDYKREKQKDMYAELFRLVVS